jgi:hypothetical protein
MNKAVEIENIEEMRRQVGIDDVELRQAIRGLRTGDVVRLTFLADTTPPVRETLLVRITWSRGAEFRGRLTGRPTSPALSGLAAGARVAFRAAHIHSLAKVRLTRAR